MRVWFVGLVRVPEGQWEMPPAPRPGTRWGHSADLDITRGRILIAGGFFTQPMDVWSLTLGSSASWTQLSPSGQAPAGRYDHGAAYDPTGDQLIIFGGQTSGPSNEVWRLSFAGTAWEQLSPLGSSGSGPWPLRDPDRATRPPTAR